jgi:hypothetical protein
MIFGLAAFTVLCSAQDWQAQVSALRPADTGRTPARIQDTHLCLVYFGITGGNYGIGFWLPQVIK